MRETGPDSESTENRRRPWVFWAVGLALLLIAIALGGRFYSMASTTGRESASDNFRGVGIPLVRNVRLERPQARPYLGITYQEIRTKASDPPVMPAVVGAMVVSIAPGSPAAMAGINKGDIILAVDGEKFGQGNPLLRLLLDRRPGDRVRLTILRGQDQQSIEVVLGKK